jgi:hypothetical protein
LTQSTSEPPAAIPTREGPPASLQKSLKDTLGFVPSTRTLNYIARRVRESKMDPDAFAEALSSVKAKFSTIYREIAEREPFTDEDERDVDALNVVNFSLFRKRQTAALAEAGLRDILARRFKLSFEWDMHFEGRADLSGPARSSGRFEVGMTVVAHDDSEWLVVDIAPSTNKRFDGVVHLELPSRLGV